MRRRAARLSGGKETGGDLRVEKILVVDDDKNICELLRLYIDKEGYQMCIRDRYWILFMSCNHAGW